MTDSVTLVNIILNGFRSFPKFLKLAFAGGHREASFPCSRCENRKMLLDEMSAHLAKKGFMSNYLLRQQHGEVKPLVADELDGNNDVNRMDDMVADIGRGYDLESEDPPLEVQNFYMILVALEEKVHDGTDVTVFQVVTCLWCSNQSTTSQISATTIS
jgi:hypothetical protein